MRYKATNTLADYDWDALRQAALGAPAAASPLTARLDRDQVLAKHERLVERERNLDRAKQIRTGRAVIGPGKRCSEKAVDQLKPLSEGFCTGQVLLDAVTEGSLLPVRLLTPPLRTTSIQFVVEDCKGQALPVQLFGVPTRIPAVELQDWFPVGAIFGVKEPLFRSLNDGSYYIRIEAPSDFVRLYPRSSPVDFPKGPAGSSTTASAPPIHWLAGLDARGLKTAGDKAYSDRRYVRAKEAYEQALDALGGEAAAETSEAEPDLRARVYANLAQTYLNLDLPRLASRATENGRKDLEAASAAASDPPSTSNLLLLRLLYRAALGNYRADRDAAALQHLQDLLRRDPSNGEAEALLARVQTRQHQAGQGPDADALRNLWSSSVDMQRRGRRVPSSQPDIANWISPDLAIEPVSGKGNGLVARRAVRRGELLMCVKPLACARGPRAGQLRYTAGVNLWTESEDPWAVGEVVSELLWQAALEGDAREEDGTASRLAPLWAGPDLGRCHKVADSPPGPSHVEGAVTFNGFHVEELSASTLEDGDPSLRSRADPDDLFHAPTALYPEHSSALNHSCVANCTYSFVNSVFLLRARVDIKEGEELVDSYVDATDPLEARRSKLAVHGFVCACALCAEEVAVSAETRRRRVELVRVAQKQAKGDADALQNIVAELEATYPASVRTKPALYTPLRLLSQALAAADSGSTASSSSAIANELKALECLGAVFSGSEGTEILAEPPRLRDMDGVLSALWIATEWQRRGRTQACRHWVALAEEIEAGQGGREFFRFRYGDWARKHGLNLGE